MNRIVLNMILGNEGKIIERCLRAAAPHIDGAVLSVNGTDDTEQIARGVLTDLGVPFVIVRDTFVNFSVTRTRAAEIAREWVERRGWELPMTWLLLLDADMVLRVEPGCDRKELTGPYIRLTQVQGTLRYQNTRLIGLSHRWRCVSVTHEYWAPSPDAAPMHIGSMWIDDRDDGGSKRDKYKRDLRLLEQGLLDEPGNVRYLFYVAQTYYYMGHYQQAHWWYQLRERAGGWPDEVWYSRYAQGLCYLRLGDLEKAAGVLLDAFERRPRRVEPLIALARAHREQGRNQAAYLLAERALRVPLPADEALFVDAEMHTRGALQEFAICGYYVGERGKGRWAAEKLLAEKGAPGPWLEHIGRCVSFYCDPLPASARGQFTVDPAIRTKPGRFFGLADPSTTEYLCSNPTLVRHEGNVFGNVRLVNYRHERGRVFEPKDPDGVVRTRNVLQRHPRYPMDAEGLTTSHGIEECEIETVLPEGWDHTTRVRGLEDQRWVSHAGRIYFTATCFNVPGAGGMPRVVLGRLNETLTATEHVVALQYAGSGRYEKNWLPWSPGDGHLYVIYGYSPFRVLRVDPDTGACAPDAITEPPWNTTRWRGSCAPIPWQRTEEPTGRVTWLGMVHETAWFDHHTVYMHRFFEFDDQRRLTRRSGLFFFEHSGVEYAAGMLGFKDHVVVAHSVEESAAKWKRYSWEQIDALLVEGDVGP